MERIHLIYLKSTIARSDGDNRYPEQGYHGDTQSGHWQPLLNNEKLRQWM